MGRQVCLTVPSKTIQRQLSSGNTIVKTWVGACFMGNSALALGSRSTGLSKSVQQPWTRFKVAKWGTFCHWARLQSGATRLK